MSETRIALLRGINVGGRNIVPMAQLRALLAGAGFADVQTYIQSGNLVFRASRRPSARLAADIGTHIEREFGCRPAVHVLTPGTLTAALANNPFADRTNAEKTVHLLFLAARPDAAAVSRARALAAASEESALRDDVFYLYAPDGVGRSRLLKGAEKALGVSATARNLRTCQKILSLAQG